MSDKIVVIKKPDTISWDTIHDILWAAHGSNRGKGIMMRYPSLSGVELRDKFEGKGATFVAMSDNQVVGTATVIRRKISMWCGKGDYAYCCLAAVLPDYCGRGIYHLLSQAREKEAHQMGLNRMVFDTHESNERKIGIECENGYRKVKMHRYGNHFNVVMVKWLDNCPYMKWYCRMRFLLSCILVKNGLRK